MKIFLVGFMGSGKSHWGKIWAEKNAMNFFDLDELIEEQEKKTIATIFELDGEDYFRKKEAVVLRTFSGTNDSIIACGGGTPCYHDNMKWMNEHGGTVYLETTARELFDRVLKEQEARPLVKTLNRDELHFFIGQRLKEREPFYKMADIILNSKELDEQTFSNEVLKKMSEKLK